jgi:predicted Rossmann-fold nucleotide-binding protein
MPEAVYQSSLQAGYRSEKQDLDLHTGDLKLTAVKRESRNVSHVTLSLSNVSPMFQGFNPDAPLEFILRSSLTQLGVDAHFAAADLKADTVNRSVSAEGKLLARTPLGVLTLDYIDVGSRVGKIFCPQQHRLLRTIEHFEQIRDSKDMRGQPLIVVGKAMANGAMHDDKARVEVHGGRLVLYLPVRQGVVRYDGDVPGMLPTIGLALKAGKDFKSLVQLHQSFAPDHTRVGRPNDVLLVKSAPLKLRTLFGRVVSELLPPGLKCASSSIIEPQLDEVDVKDRTFVFSGESTEELTHIPIEFYCLEGFREQLPLELRPTLMQISQDPAAIGAVFKTAPQECKSCCFFATTARSVTELRTSDWVEAEPHKLEGHEQIMDSVQRRDQATRYLYQQPEYPVLSAINVGDITSDGILLTRYYPSPIIKSLLLGRQVMKRVRAIFFTNVSRTFGSFFSQEDRAMMIDLNTFGIQLYFYEESTGKMYQFIRRQGGDCGMFVPLDRRAEYLNSTFFGVYGSNLVAGDFESELTLVMKGVLEMKKTTKHPMLAGRPLSLVTGGGPGAMEVGNRVAKGLGIISCGMFVDFGAMAKKPGVTINEQKKNPYVEAFMTYRPEKLVERQSDFNLDFPIFLVGGVGTDFEYALEEVRRKVCTVPPHPLVLFGSVEHWGAKIGGRFKANAAAGTIKGSEWLSNIPYIVSTGKQALAVYKRYFDGTLPIGPANPPNPVGYVVVDDAFVAAAGL